MNADRSPVGTSAAALRDAFDQSFAEALALEPASVEDVLAIDVAGAPFALRTSDIAGIFVDKTIARLPTPVTGLLGVVGVRSAVLPVYDLRVLLGRPPGGAPRWMVATGEGGVGLAFDRFDGHFRVRRDDVVAAVGSGRGDEHVRDVVHILALVRPIVCVASVLDAIVSAVQAVAPRKER